LTGNPSVYPFTGAHLWVSAANSDVTPGASPYTANIINAPVDITDGGSGGPLYTDDGNYYVVGVCSNDDVNMNYFNRFTPEVWAFLSAHSPF
jgi:hypothetical protein